MAIFYNPRTVTNGLVLALDAANPKSYPGSGTTWTDLSGNGNNGTLVNGVGYSGDNLGSLVFDGVNDYVTVPSTNGLYLAGTSSVTVSCWAKSNNLTNKLQNLVMWEDVANSDNIEPIRLVINSNNDNPQFAVVNNSGTVVNIDGIVTTLSSTYYNLVGTYNGSTVSIYVNGSLSNQGSLTGNFRTPTSGTSAKWIIGRGEVSRADRLLNGNISQVSIYNRALTAQEIQQNFNATRSRFSI